MSGTKYYLMKKCLNCWHITDIDSKKCPSCSLLFIGEATFDEKNKANEKLAGLTEKSEENNGK